MKSLGGRAAALIAFGLLAVGVVRHLREAPSSSVSTAASGSASRDTAPADRPLPRTQGSGEARPGSAAAEPRTSILEPRVAWAPPPSPEGHKVPPGSFQERHARAADANDPKTLDSRSPRQTATQWIADYQREVCACPTRSCVRDLQGKFAAARMSFDAERDDSAYADGAREAIRCYYALPEES